MNANIDKTQIFHKGYLISNMTTFLFKNQSFSTYFCLKSNLTKTLYEFLHYKDTHCFYKIEYDLRGH